MQVNEVNAGKNKTKYNIGMLEYICRARCAKKQFSQSRSKILCFYGFKRK